DGGPAAHRREGAAAAGPRRPLGPYTRPVVVDPLDKWRGALQPLRRDERAERGHHEDAKHHGDQTGARHSRKTYLRRGPPLAVPPWAGKNQAPQPLAGGAARGAVRPDDHRDGGVARQGLGLRVDRLDVRYAELVRDEPRRARVVARVLDHRLRLLPVGGRVRAVALLEAQLDELVGGLR